MDGKAYSPRARKSGFQGGIPGYEADVENLYLVANGFPGFGIAGVMASGYYLAKEILKDEGIDLKKEIAKHFRIDNITLPLSVS